MDTLEINNIDQLNQDGFYNLKIESNARELKYSGNFAEGKLRGEWYCSIYSSTNSILIDSTIYYFNDSGFNYKAIRYDQFRNKSQVDFIYKSCDDSIYLMSTEKFDKYGRKLSLTHHRIEKMDCEMGKYFEFWMYESCNSQIFFTEYYDWYGDKNKGALIITCTSNSFDNKLEEVIKKYYKVRRGKLILLQEISGRSVTRYFDQNKIDFWLTRFNIL